MRNLSEIMTILTNILIREYEPQEKDSIRNLFLLNTPKYFSKEEENDLIYYLDNEIDNFYVLEYNNQVIGCGGINRFENNTMAKLSWDILHPSFQTKGLGILLVNYRINKLKEEKRIKNITVRTSQHVYKFYEKADFKLIEKIKDYWAEGFDLYKMEYCQL